MLHQRVRQTTPEKKNSSTRYGIDEVRDLNPSDDKNKQSKDGGRSCCSFLFLAIQSSYATFSKYPCSGLRFTCANKNGHKLRRFFLPKRKRHYIRKGTVILLFTIILFIIMMTIHNSFWKLNIDIMDPNLLWSRGDSMMELKINTFDASKIDDLGGFLHPTKYHRFPSFRQMPKIVDGDIDDTNTENSNSGDSRSGDSPKTYKPDYGGLDNLKFLSKDNFQRVVEEEERTISSLNFTEYHKNGKSVNKKRDKEKAEKMFGNDDDTTLPKSCHRIAWEQSVFPNCNSVHEIDLKSKLYLDEFPYAELSAEPFSHGFYRDAWLVRSPINSTHLDDKETFVMKTIRFKHTFGSRAFENVRKDALIMERLTKSPRIVNIYGHCGSTVSVEELESELEDFAVPNGFMKKEDLKDTDDVKPQNTFSPTDKLEISLEMAKGLADLHGFEGGIIVHDDVQLCQWLYAKDGTLKLGDFNRATVMLYNEQSGKYCKFNNGKAYGDYRSPEEFARRDLDENIDVFSFGNNMYALLTGLWPFYDKDDDGYKQNQVMLGHLAFIDERYKKRSFAEQKLTELIEKCWEFDPKDRVTIFEIIDYLSKALQENKLLDESKYRT